MKFTTRGTLWQHRDFLKFWFGDTVSQFTSQVTGLAIPLIAIRIFNAQALEMGILNALQMLAFPLFGLFVGVWADRYRRRPIMIFANLIRMTVLASVPIAFVYQSISLNQLYLVVFIIGVCTVFFDVAYQSYLPSLVDQANIIEGNSKLQLSASGGQVVGPAFAGALFTLVGLVESVVVDVGGYLTSAVSLLCIRRPEPTPKPAFEDGTRDFIREMKEGIDVVIRNPLLSSIAACTATSNLGTNMAAAVLLLFAVDALGIPNSLIWIPFTAGSLGFFLGAFVTNSLTKKLGLGWAISLGAIGSVVIVAVPVATVALPLVTLSIIYFVWSIFVPIYNINQVSLRQTIVAGKLQGRMNATMRTIVWGTIPLGSFLGGLLGSSIGVLDTIVLGGLLSSLSVIWILRSPVRSLKRMPSPSE